MDNVDPKLVLIVWGIAGVILLIAIIAGNNDIKKYMAKQKKTENDKKRMSNFLQQVFGVVYDKYTYVVAWNVKSENHMGDVTTYYLSYFVAFNQTEMQIVSFVVNNGQLLCRNVMPVDLVNMNMKYKVTKGGVKFSVGVGKDKIEMTVDRVTRSEGVEKSSRPLGIYQEAEVDKLISLLPNYPTKH